MLTFIRTLFAQQEPGQVSVLGAVVTNRASVSLTGQTLPNGRPLFTSTVATLDGAITVVTEIDTYAAAKRHHRKMLRAWA